MVAFYFSSLYFGFAMPAYTTRILCLCSLFLTFLQAQIYPIRHFTTNDGLVSNSVISMAQDPLGRLWIGTDEGVSIFNGNSFTDITIADGLSNSRINCILPSAFDSTIVWLGTNGGGLSEYSPKGIRNYSLPKQILQNNIIELCEINDSTVYCGTANGVVVFNVSEHRFNSQQLLKGNGIDAVFSLHGNDVFALTGNQIFRLSDSTAALVFTLPGDRFGAIQSYCKVSSRQYVFGTEKGWIVLWDGTGIVQTLHPVSSPISCIAISGGHYYIGIPGGICDVRATDVPPQILSKQNGLLSDDVTGLLVDNDGLLWIQHYGTGLSCIRSFAAEKIVIPPSFNAPNGSSASSDSHDHIWICLHDGLAEFRRTATGQWMFDLHSSIGSYPLHASSLFIDSHNHFWIGDTAGNVMQLAVQYRPNRKSRLSVRQFFSSGGLLPRAPIMIVYEDSKHRVWCSYAENNGIFIIPQSRKQHIVHLLQDNGIPDNSVRAIEEDSDGNVWLGGYDGGLCAVQSLTGTTTIQNYRSQLTAGERAIRSITSVGKDALFIGTRYRGVLNFHDGKFTRSTVSRSGVWCSTLRHTNEVIFGTQRGIRFVRHDSLKTPPLLREFVDEPVFAVGTLSDSTVWATTSTSLIIYTDIHAVHNPPNIWIQSIDVNGIPIDFRHPFELSYNDNTISVQVDAASMWSGNNLLFQWRFLTPSSRWSAPVAHRSLTFASLSPGKYDLEVRAVDFNGKTTLNPAAASFTIDLPFWRTWWFITLTALSIALVAGGIVWSKASQLLAIERLRSRIAGDLHDEIGSGLTRIALISDVLKKQVMKKRRTPQEIRATPDLLETVHSTAQQLVESLGDVVWSLDTNETSMTHLIQRFSSFAGELCEAQGIQLLLNIDDTVHSVTLAQAQLSSLLLFLKEAVTNIVRHSGATESHVEIHHSKKKLQVTISDNGKGFDASRRDGNGIRTMQRRIERLGGIFSIRSEKRSGTTVSAEIPVTVKTA